MKTFLLCCYLLCFTARAQSRHVANPIKTAKQSAPKPAPLSDAFAKSALRLLRMIEAETGALTTSKDGGYLVPRATSQAIDDLDVDATSADEVAIVSALKQLFSARTLNNLSVSTFYTLADAELISAGQPRGTANITSLVRESPTVLQIHRQEAACEAEMEAALRSRLFSSAPACSEKALDVVVPKDFDVWVQPLNPVRLANAIAEDPALVEEIKENNKNSADLPSSLASKEWDMIHGGHTLTDLELSALRKVGQASQLLIFVTPFDARFDIDGLDAGRARQGFTMIRHGNTPRVLKIHKEGYITVEQSLLPDGQDVVVGTRLVKMDR